MTTSPRPEVSRLSEVSEVSAQPRRRASQIMRYLFRMPPALSAGTDTEMTVLDQGGGHFR